MAFYLVHKIDPRLRFKIVGLDKETMIATLKGETSDTPFTRSIKQDDLDKYGYSVVKVDEAQPQEAAS